MLYGLFKIYNIWTFLINKVNKVKIETVKYVEVVDVSVISAKKGATDSLSEFSACVSFQMEIWWLFPKTFMTTSYWRDS